ncbi:hypothetical protein [Bacillus solimangrovi]|uniref:Uncharacterized protein n=1 Tax=Bacillus solimangrovi TaxID=1305675 RepID=A0A1E5LB94_9BACI|nr:hypothetical protein [Bacillus solimangrovi]OEH91355.1 hypothetical protein BFG57_05675 [Bacillus solimangrovi]
MLTFEEKLTIIDSFTELDRKNVSLGRVNYHFEGSGTEKKIVVYHLHPNGNGFVYTGLMEGYPTNNKGMTNIRDFSEVELRTVIEESIQSLLPRPDEEPIQIEEEWVNSENQSLVLVNEDDMWNVYAGRNLDGTFPSYNEAKQYLDEEGFKRR